MPYRQLSVKTVDIKQSVDLRTKRKRALDELTFAFQDLAKSALLLVSR